jgi:hypothetical protein
MTNYSTKMSALWFYMNINKRATDIKAKAIVTNTFSSSYKTNKDP